ncbi:MAG: CoA transferase, partial [Burkholderiales bacterium]
VGVPCGPINSLADAFADPQVVARGLRFDLPHPSAGSVPMVGNPIRYSDTPIEYKAPPPLLGQHTDEVLRWLNYDDQEIARLRANRIL